MERTTRTRLLLSLAVLGAASVAQPGSANAAPASAEAAPFIHRSLPAPVAPFEGADEVVMAFSRSVADADLHVLWDLMPTRYQRDMTRVVHTFGANVDSDVWDKSFDIVHKFGNLLDAKKRLILSMPNIKNKPGFDAKEASAQWGHMVSLFTTIAQSDVAHVESLQRMDVRRFLGTTGSAMMADIIALSEIDEDGAAKLHQFTAMTASIVSQSNINALVRIEVPTQGTHNQDFTLVDGKWVPTKLATDWNKTIAEALKGLDNLSSEEFRAMKPQIMQVLNALEGTIDQLHAARTHKEFEKGLQSSMMEIFGLVMAMNRGMN